MVARTRSQTARAQRCRGTGGCHTRSSTGRLQCVTQCRWRCSVAECRNTAVCNSPPLVGAKRGDFCEPCTALLACAPVLRAETGECGVCLEVKQLYVLPMCKIHKTCAGCSRRILYGTLPEPGASAHMTVEQTIAFIEDNMHILLHRQTCPFCPATDGRSPAHKLRDIRAGGGKASGYLKETVERGLELLNYFDR